MAPRMKRLLMLAGFCSLAAMFVGEGETLAASSAGAITIIGGYKPGGGDPPFDYIFDVFLNAPGINTPGTNTFMAGDSFTVDGLPGVDSNSFHNEPFNPPGVAWAGGALNTVPTPQPPGSAPFASDFSWQLTGTTVYTASTPQGGPVGSSVLLGVFTVESSYDFPNGVLPFPDGTLVNFTFTADGGGTGQFPIMNLSVPEPSSAILLATGAGVLPMFWLRERRRRQKRQAIA